MSFGLILLLNAVMILAVALWLRGLVVRRVAPGRLLSDLEREIAELTAEVNRTGDYQISLLEDRIAQARSMVEAASDAERRLTDLLERVDSHPTVETFVLSLERHRERAAHAEETSSGTAAQGAAASPSQVAGAASGDPQTPQSAPSDAGEGAPPGGDNEAAEPRPVTVPEPSVAQTGTARRRDDVLAAYGRGLPIERIAAETGMALGEVELIISLREQRGRR